MAYTTGFNACQNKQLTKLADDVLIVEGNMQAPDSVDIYDESKYDWSKIDIEGCRFGDKVRICWKMDGYKFSDIGYLTALPGVGDHDDISMSAVIHCPTPENPGGMGQPEGEFISLLSAVQNPALVSVKPIRRRE